MRLGGCRCGEGMPVLGYWGVTVLGPEWVHDGFRWERGSLVRSRVPEFIPAFNHANGSSTNLFTVFAISSAM